MAATTPKFSPGLACGIRLICTFVGTMSSGDEIRPRAGVDLLEARITLLEARLTQCMIDNQRAMGLFFVLMAIVIFIK